MSVVTLQRRASDGGEPTNREILDKLNAFLDEHRRDHSVLDARINASDKAAALLDARVVVIQRMTEEIATLHDFKVQVQTIGSSVKWILGGSLLSALAAVASLLITVSHIGATP
jgi:hypothetical protein